MIFHGRNGLLVAVEDVDELAAAIAKMLNEPTFACQIGEQAARDCREWFDAAKVAERTVSFYSRVIKSHRALRTDASAASPGTWATRSTA
jgi:glycosyltransferase involved in cell wall biosynthesis